VQALKVTNTLTKRKEDLVPIQPGLIKMYACGVTVYDHCHIGHAMQAIYFDTIRNYLEYIGYKVQYVRNFTDVDDKIIARAKDMGIPPLQLSQQIIESSDEDMKSLGIRPADVEPKVSDTIPEIIQMIEKLVEKGHAYATSEGNVYFRVRTKADYGKLSNRNLEEAVAGTRDIHEGDKEDDHDFALWKSSTVEGAKWPSPWGVGRPGWHIECSAMAKKFLGDSFDIHGGGRDLVFPHHENEIAQSEAANSTKFANYWLHSGLLTINKQKMSKSLGNHILIRDFVKKWPAEVLRLAYLLQHYTSNTDFSESVFQLCAKRLLYYYETIRAIDLAVGLASFDKIKGDPIAVEATKQFHEAMSDDFNTVKAIGELNGYFKKANELLKGKKSTDRDHSLAVYGAVLRELFGVLSILKHDAGQFIATLKGNIIKDLGLEESYVTKLIEERAAARAAKDYARGDEIRKELLTKGIVLKDSPMGTDWTIDFNL
jgi:cysteinyl-tRNA synthetase